MSKNTRNISPFILIFAGLLLSGGFYTLLKPMIFRSADVNLIGQPASICQVPSFAASTPLTTPNFTYPAVVKNANSPYTMFVGGLTSTLPANLKSLPGRQRYPVSQEEIWLQTSTDLTSWSAPTPSFAIMPETPVAFKNNQQYQTVYPNSFKSGCAALPEGLCNVQINDPSVVSFNGSLYLYFSILENYRWYDGTLGSIKDSNPTNPTDQNRHSIGLAVSGDNGKNWAFVDKVIPENKNDSTGKSILGAWAPSALVVDNNTVELYFHDALGTKQYVATLTGGASLKSITRLNPNDQTYRTNLDVIKVGNKKVVAYNDSSFNVAQSVFTSPSDFSTLCPATTVVPASPGSIWPTPHQYVKDNQVHLYFWEFDAPSTIHHWVRPL